MNNKIIANTKDLDENKLKEMISFKKTYHRIKDNRQYNVIGFCRTQEKKTSNWDEMRVLVAPLDKPEISYAIHVQDFLMEYA